VEALPASRFSGNETADGIADNPSMGRNKMCREGLEFTGIRRKA